MPARQPSAPSSATNIHTGLTAVGLSNAKQDNNQEFQFLKAGVSFQVSKMSFGKRKQQPSITNIRRKPKQIKAGSTGKMNF